MGSLRGLHSLPGGPDPVGHLARVPVGTLGHLGRSVTLDQLLQRELPGHGGVAILSRYRRTPATPGRFTR